LSGPSKTIGIGRLRYARVSTCDQNLDLQIRALTAAGCAEIFRDDGISAVAPERPAFAEVLGALQSGDTLVIWKMDRAFRSLIHALTVLDELERRGIEFQSLTEEIDTATAMGRFVYQIRNAFTELERAIISERTRAGGAAVGRPRKLTESQVALARIELAAERATIAHLARRYHVAPLTLSRALRR
jgi:DNA invertase Pin-like site-specific DNA recombinase